MNKIYWGIIGCGDVCEVKSGPAFQLIENSDLIAVMRRNKEKAADYAKRHNVNSWFTDADDLINHNGVNAIYIATPPSTHAHYTIKALEAGKPVYVEKPMALNYAECLKMIEASIHTGTPLYVAYYRRAFPYFLKIKEIVDTKLLGTILNINLTTVLAPRKEDYNQDEKHWHIDSIISGGGYFFDVACHQLDILDFLAGPIEDAHGWYTNRAKIYSVEDTLVANLRFKSGVLASCLWTYVGHIATETDRIEIFGTEGSLTFSISADSPIILKTGRGREEFNFEKPKHVEMPMIELVVKNLTCGGSFESNMESAARTSWIMDKVMGRI